MAARVGPPPHSWITGLLLIGVSSLRFRLRPPPSAARRGALHPGRRGSSVDLVRRADMADRGDPGERKGSAIGDVLAVAIAGELLGPALGALAAGVGTKVVSRLGAHRHRGAGDRRIPGAGRSGGVREPASRGFGDRQPPGADRDLVPGRPIADVRRLRVAGAARIGDLGGGAGDGWRADSCWGRSWRRCLAHLDGRPDRVGRIRPYVVGLAALRGDGGSDPGSGQALGPMFAISVTVAFGAGLCFGPAMTMLSDAAAATGLHQGFSAGLTNMAWAAGQVCGGVAGGAAAQAAGDALPLPAVWWRCCWRPPARPERAGSFGCRPPTRRSRPEPEMTASPSLALALSALSPDRGRQRRRRASAGPTAPPRLRGRVAPLDPATRQRIRGSS